MITNNFYKGLDSNKDWEKFFNSRLKINGYIFKSTDFIDISGKVRFVHFSPNVEKIIADGSIAVSGGGLFGVVYVTPLRKNGEVHNLGRYIIEKEIPQIRGKITEKCIIFEINKDDYLKSTKNGAINYIFDSKVFCDCVTSFNKKNPVLNQVIVKTKGINSYLKKMSYNNKELWTFVEHYFEKFPFMKHVFFESFIEYLYINQNTEKSRQYAACGELYASNIKDYIFEISPKLKSSFSTSKFETRLLFHINKLKNSNKIIQSFNDKDFVKFMRARLSFYFSQIIEMENSPILGRFILKSSNPKDQQKVEQCGAEKMWSKIHNCSALHYSSIPKGEWGIKPTVNNLKIYSGYYLNGVVEKLDQIPLKIRPEVLSNEEAVLRIK